MDAIEFMKPSRVLRIIRMKGARRAIARQIHLQREHALHMLAKARGQTAVLHYQ